ncbi:hypothetical protein LguiA_027599 [Lonicera macranthoides]
MAFDNLHTGYTLRIHHGEERNCGFTSNNPPPTMARPRYRTLKEGTESTGEMGIKLIKIVEAKQKIQRNSSPRNENLPGKDDPKYHFVVYVGRAHEQFVVPISYLNQPLFQELLDWAEEEFGFEHPMGIEIHIYNLRKIQNGNPMLAIMLSKQPLCRELLRRAEEEYGFVYPMGASRGTLYLGNRCMRFLIIRRNVKWKFVMNQGRYADSVFASKLYTKKSVSNYACTKLPYHNHSPESKPCIDKNYSCMKFATGSDSPLFTGF